MTGTAYNGVFKTLKKLAVALNSEFEFAFSTSRARREPTDFDETAKLVAYKQKLISFRFLISKP